MKNAKKILSMILCMVMFLTLSVQAYASENLSTEEYDTSDENLCYSVSETAEGADALVIVEDEDVLQRIKDHQFDHEIVSASKQSVYFVNDKKDLDSLKARGNTLVDDDATTHESAMTLYLVVYKDASGNYYAYGTADWATGLTGTGADAQAAGYDHIAITWGGTKAFKASASSVSGYYNDDDNTAISITKEKSDSYQGYSWRFNEYKASTSWFGDPLRAEYIDCYVKLTRVNSTITGEETSIKLTYIHTYVDLDLTIEFTPSSDGGAHTVTWTENDATWDAAVDVPGIEY